MPPYGAGPTWALYIHENQRQTEVVQIMHVHYDDGDAYYTIKMPSGRERQTERNRLLLIA